MYLATVIDAHNRRIIGWAIADNRSTDLIQDALTMAMVQPKAKSPPRSLDPIHPKTKISTQREMPHR